MRPLNVSGKTYKRRFDKELKHVKNILAAERHKLSVPEWLELVRKTKESVLDEPETFFGADLPARPVLCEIIDSVFAGFLEDQRLLANQTDKKFKIPVWLKST